MILIETPPGYEAERRYVSDVLFREFLGLDFHLRQADRTEVRISVPDGGESRELLLADVLFQTPLAQWLTGSSLPVEPLARWKAALGPAHPPLIDAEVPVLYGRPSPDGTYLTESGDAIRLGIDIAGSAFFMLSRLEEVVCSARDRHGRFPASASLAHREAFLGRPLVNEYLELLWWALQRLWPRLARRARSYRVCLTHDVDEVHCTAGRPVARVLRSAAGDLFRRRSLPLALRRLRSLAAVRRGDLGADICNTFDFIMHCSERRGLRSAFYFITDHTGGAIDGTYAISSPWVRQLLRRIHERGHEIGLHPSYHTYRDPQQIKREFAYLQEAARAAGVEQERWGGRQHYLRWEAPTTWQAWEDAGLAYDSTLSFADRAGFRCGVCYEYPVFHLHTRAPLKLRERPLIFMEATALEYMGMEPAQALAAARTLAEQCRRYGGEFTLLWHNTRLLTAGDRDLYEQVLDAL